MGGRVYVPVSGDQGRPSVVALALADGRTLWQTVLVDQSGADLYSSPVVVGRSLYIGTSAGLGEYLDPNVRIRGSVVALDSVTGRLRWKTYTVPGGYDGGAVVTSAAVDTRRGRLFVPVGAGNILRVRLSRKRETKDEGSRCCGNYRKKLAAIDAHCCLPDFISFAVRWIA